MSLCIIDDVKVKRTLESVRPNAADHSPSASSTRTASVRRELLDTLMIKILM